MSGVIITVYQLDARAILGNTSQKFFIQPELARSVWRKKGLYLLVWYEQLVT